MLDADKSKSWIVIDRRCAFAAALPLFLFGLLVAAITVFLLTIGDPSQILDLADASLWHNSALVIGMIALAVLVAAAFFALFGRLPLWSYTWLGAGLTGLLIALVLVGEDREFIISPIVDMTVFALFLLSVLITFGVAASEGWQHAGLYSIGTSATLGLSLCFFGVAGPFQSNLGLLAALMGGAEAALVYTYIRRSDVVRVAVLLSIAVANAGVAWIVEWLFRLSNPSRELSQFWYLVVLLTALLFGGTLMGFSGRFVKRILRRRQGG